ncbi:MAG TPA: response regulator [Burkholderiales bacterium]|jgi:CheY-like chemotaxis protein|nr:response regulator [Burkholderiales bacterium]
MNFYLVDDDPDILAMLSRVLEEAGHRVESSPSSLQALKQIPMSRPDCVITDIMMPEMDGFELTRELRRRPELRDMKIVVLSAKTYDFDRRRARELGADGFISKPFQRTTLLDSIMEVVSSRVVVSYWGVHGTLPAPGAGYVRYGGNTPCVSVEIGGEPLYIFDCGSGIKRLSDHIMAAGSQRFSARIFVSHTHWDHINTVPFFAPLYVRGNQIELFGPYQGDLTIERAVSAQMESVYFPVTVREFGARLVFRDLREETLEFGPVRIDTMLLSHPGYCLGYRLTARGRSVCYITDNELYLPGDPRHNPRYFEQLANFVKQADLLITDATYRDSEYPAKVDWGHSCVSQVAELAARAQVKRLHLFHHDPDQTDDLIDLKLKEAREALARLGAKVECDAPAEETTLAL